VQIYAYKNQERDSVTIKIDKSLKTVTVTNNDLKPFKTLKGENKKVKKILPIFAPIIFLLLLQLLKITFCHSHQVKYYDVLYAYKTYIIWATSHKSRPIYPNFSFSLITFEPYCFVIP